MRTIISPCPTSVSLRKCGVFTQDRDLGDEADYGSEESYSPSVKSLYTRVAPPQAPSLVIQTGFARDRDTGDETAHSL
jgi:hypothetical protein